MVDTGEEATAEDVAKKKQEASKLMQEAEKKWTLDANAYIQAEQEFLKASALEQLVHHK